MKKPEGQRNATILYRDVFPLPNNPTVTKTRCIQLTIPDDDQHMAAFLGAISLLTKWNSWARDDAHQGTLCAQTWQRALGSQENFAVCQTRPTIITEEIDDMGVRVDCDCNVFITCCDGTEKQILTSQQVQDLINSSGPGNAPQPPAGGCQLYHGAISGLSKSLVPFPVSTGDTVEIQNGSGASNGSNLGRWNCTDGDQFFAGTCSPYTQNDAGALMPGVPIGTLIVNIDGTWYDGRSLITVPGGVTNVQPEVALNYDQSFTASGNVSFDVNVCNNAAATYTHTFDFTISSGGWLQGSSYGALWTAGIGWKTSAIGVFINLTLANSVSMSGIDVYFNTDGADQGSSCSPQQIGAEDRTIGGGSVQWFIDCIVPWSGHNSATYNGAFSIVAGHQLEIGATNIGSTQWTISKIVIRGNGTDPF